MQVVEVVHHAPLGKSGHDVITLKFNCYLDNSESWLRSNEEIFNQE